MCGTIAHVLNIDFFKLMKMARGQLNVLYNEATRQRALDSVDIARGFNGGDSFQKQVQEAMSVHGDYTKGYWEAERNRLKKDMGVE